MKNVQCTKWCKYIGYRKFPLFIPVFKTDPCCTQLVEETSTLAKEARLILTEKLIHYGLPKSCFFISLHWKFVVDVFRLELKTPFIPLTCLRDIYMDMTIQSESRSAPCREWAVPTPSWANRRKQLVLTQWYNRYTKITEAVIWY